MSRNSKKILPVIENAITALESGYENASAKSPRLEDGWLNSWLGRIANNGRPEDATRAEMAVSELRTLRGRATR